MLTAVAIFLAFIGWCGAFACGSRHERLTEDNSLAQGAQIVISAACLIAALVVVA